MSQSSAAEKRSRACQALKPHKSMWSLLGPEHSRVLLSLISEAGWLPVVAKETLQGFLELAGLGVQ